MKANITLSHKPNKLTKSQHHKAHRKETKQETMALTFVEEEAAPPGPDQD